MSGENDELPNGWAKTTLEEIARDVTYGYTAKSNRTSGGAKMLRITDIQDNRVNWSQVPFCAITATDKAKYLLKKWDLVFARTGATVGKSFLIQDDVNDAVFASYLIRVRCLDQEMAKYLSYFFNSPIYWDQITDFSAGIGQPNVNGSKLKGLAIPLAPLAEQKRIADKLETVLSRVDACRARLDRVPSLLKRFRQSILAAATSGNLTAEWRRANDPENSSRSITIGEDSITVPYSWEDTRLRDLLDSERPLCYGVVQPGEEVVDGALLIRVQDMDLGNIKVDELRTISNKVDAEYKRSRIREGDLLISVVGTIGRTAIVPANLEANIARAIARLATRKGVESRWLNYWLSCDTLQWWLASSSKEVARKTLNLSDLAIAPVALPSHAEQQEIVRRVEALFAMAERIEVRLATAQKTVERLTPATLAKAFRGELVPQNPNDEPATELLHRLRNKSVIESAPRRRKSSK